MTEAQKQALKEAKQEGYYFNDKVHLHTLDGKPLTGTSSIGDVLAKNLTWWAAELSAVECLEKGEHIPTIRAEYEEVKKKYGLEKKKAMDALCKKYPIFKQARYAHFNKKKEKADEGTDLHAELEKFVKLGERAKIDWDDPKLKSFTDWTAKNVKRFLWSEAHCFSRPLWVGGISDVGVELNNGQTGVLDFKSSAEAYITQFIQAAGYAIQIEENGLWDSNGEINRKLDKPLDFVGIVPFGAEVIEPQIRFNIEDYKKGFEWGTGLYRLMELDKQLS